MENQVKLRTRGFTILFFFTVLSLSLIPIIAIWGKPSKEIIRGAKEETVNLDIFLEERCTSKVKSIDWGELTPGGNSTAVVYLKNRSKIPLTLSCYLSEYSSEASKTYISLEWDREGYILGSREVVKALLTLYVSDTAQFEAFTVDILFIGTG